MLSPAQLLNNLILNPILVQANGALGLEGPKGADCILLQTGLDKTGRFQEAVGEAIAKTFKA